MFNFISYYYSMIVDLLTAIFSLSAYVPIHCDTCNLLPAALPVSVWATVKFSSDSLDYLLPINQSLVRYSHQEFDTS